MTDIEKAIQDLKNQERIHIDYAKDKDLTGVCLIGKSAELAIRAIEREQHYLAFISNHNIPPTEKDITEIQIQALKEKLERENPTPLTYEQLKQRVGKPVFVVYNNEYDGSLWGIVTLVVNTVVIRCPSRDIIPRENETRMRIYDYELKEELSCKPHQEE